MGYVRGTYRGLTTELCTVRLTEVNEVQREATGLWERTSSLSTPVSGCCVSWGQKFPTWLTIWPRDRLDKLFSSKTIQTGNEGFDKRFNLSSDDEAAALRILSPSRMERILALADSSIGKFAVNLNSDGRLYIAVHSGRGFFDLDKGRENPAQLRERFARELKWFTDMIEAFAAHKEVDSMPLWLAAALLVLSLSGIFLSRRYLRKPLQSVCVILCVLLAAAWRRLYRTDPSVCGCGTEPAAGIVKRDPRP